MIYFDVSIHMALLLIRQFIIIYLNYIFVSMRKCLIFNITHTQTHKSCNFNATTFG